MEIKRIGIIAGSGNIPILFSRLAKQQGIEVVAAAICKDASVFLPFFVDHIKWFKVSRLRDGFSYLKARGVTDVIMAGQVSQKNLFDPALQRDTEFKEFFDALADRKADTIFSAVADILNRNGLRVLDSTLLIKDLLAVKGTLTRRGPTENELEDIEFGRTIAKAMGGLDVGQTVVVKNKAIVAIEAMEGTDRCILRGGRIARSGAVVIKTSKPHQDSRFDVPVIGPRTLKHMIRSRCQCLGIEAGKTLIIDRKKCVTLANRSGICIISF